jgi:hypothetical protein
MGRPRSLNNLEEISKVVLEYKNDPQPTLVGLCRMLKVTPPTLYSRMDEEDEIADKLMEAWFHLVESHEKALWSKVFIPHLFYLKTIKRFGFSYKDWESDKDLLPGTKDNTLKIEVVTRDATKTI